MKKTGDGDLVGADQPRTEVAAVPAQVGAEGRTRHEVARLLLEQGPITAVVVAE
ncbi:MAG TPA: transcriptional regulator, partial [Amycolatopsis sp.]|nr:transcriptional regulator [Amycolatopsis sp.]